MDSKVDTTITLSRTLKANIQAAFDAWTTVAALTKWFAPADAFKTQVLELDVRKGGRYKIAMTDPDGKVHTAVGTYQTIERPTELVFTWKWENAETPETSLVTISFRKKGDQTELTLVHTGLATEESAKHHQQGWTGCLGRLVAMY